MKRFLIPILSFILLTASDSDRPHPYQAQLEAEYQKEHALLTKQLADRSWCKNTANQTFHPAALLEKSDRDPVDVVIRRSRVLLDHIEKMKGASSLPTLRKELDALDKANRQESPGIFQKVCALRRKIAFSNPLLDFDRLLFLTHHKAKYNHMVDQYFGHFARPGGGMYVLHNPFGKTPRVESLLEEVPVSGNRLNGNPLRNGSFISLELDYDAETAYFAWTEADPVVKKWNDLIPLEVLWKPSSTYHIFRADLKDGKVSRLTQLTDGCHNDFDPCVLPNGRIVFISERRGGFLRCGLRPDPTYTLHSMKNDGSDLRTISFHETNEWHPSITHDGMIAYTRWDYVDRDSDVAHHIWTCHPDGRDPRSFHGNYPVNRECRPWMELSIRAIPGSHRFIAVSAPHHGQAYGSLIVIDPTVDDDDAMNQVRRLTPDILLPESEKAPGVPHRPKGRHKPQAEVFGSPWPLDEHFHLAVYDSKQKNYGIFLVDAFGNRELLYRDPKVPCLGPIPLRPRPRPPVLPSLTYAPDENEKEGFGTVSVINVYESDFEWPKGSRITALRIIQLFPKTTPAATKPTIGIGNQSLARGVIGTVPVEKDGSAHFRVPAGVPIYFQALDENGMAVQSMRSATYLHRREKMTCVGCHEYKLKRPAMSTKPPLALGREPVDITPEVKGTFPLTFPRLVQPVLDRNCVGCHRKEKKAPSLEAKVKGKQGWTEAYLTLAPFAWAKHGGNGAIRKNKTSRSIAGKVGAQAASLLKHLNNHHGVKLSREDRHRLVLWLDTNSNFYGAYFKTKEQAKGAEVMPRIQ